MIFYKEIFKSIKEVFLNKNYIFLTLIFTLFMFIINVIYRNYNLVFSNLSLKLLFSLLIGFPQTTTLSGLIILSIIFLLSGIILSLSIFLIKRQIKTKLESSSIIIAIIAPACPTCTLGLFGLLGIGGIITYLPFKGMEIGIIGILLLTISLFYLSKKVNSNVCELKKIKKSNKN